MRAGIIAVVMALECLVSPGSNAQAAQNGAAGLGVVPCQQIVLGFRTDGTVASIATMRAREVDWMQGYMSGINAATDDYGHPQRELGIGTPQGMDAAWKFIGDYCRTHPAASFLAATTALWLTYPQAR